MNQTRVHHLFPVMLISTDACLSQFMTISNKDENGENLRQSSECGDDECVLQSHLGDPRGDAVELVRVSPCRNMEMGVE